jgi:hypothetical protein
MKLRWRMHEHATSIFWLVENGDRPFASAQLQDIAARNQVELTAILTALGNRTSSELEAYSPI